ncbi:MAG TPA: hypothetical protein VK866_00530 [Acidimicrobiales bacterium]|nr:hypothetical protein [Acidimicrobiales bacterium]
MSVTEPATTPQPRSRLDRVLPERVRQLALAALFAAVLGLALGTTAELGPSIVGWVLSSVVAVALLSAARRTDVREVPAHDADPPPFVRIGMTLILLVALTGTVVNAWWIATELAR